MKLLLKIIILILIIKLIKNKENVELSWPLSQSINKPDLPIKQIYGQIFIDNEEFFHTGLDIYVNNKTNVYSIGNGFVEKVSSTNGVYEIIIIHKSKFLKIKKI
jgi:hypothetical protein